MAWCVASFPACAGFDADSSGRNGDGALSWVKGRQRRCRHRTRGKCCLDIGFHDPPTGPRAPQGPKVKSFPFSNSPRNWRSLDPDLASRRSPGSLGSDGDPADAADLGLGKPRYRRPSAASTGLIALQFQCLAEDALGCVCTPICAGVHPLPAAVESRARHGGRCIEPPRP